VGKLPVLGVLAAVPGIGYPFRSLVYGQRHLMHTSRELRPSHRCHSCLGQGAVGDAGQAPEHHVTCWPGDTVPVVTPDVLVGLLAEPERLRVVAALVLGARTPSQLIDATGLGQRAVGRALQRLQTGELVSTNHDGFTVHIELFKQVARITAPQPKLEDHGYVDERTESAVRRFIQDGRLMRLPAQRSRRVAVLEHLAQSFQPGLRYSEKEVDGVLREWCAGGEADHVSLRRCLVDEGLLSREGGTYWRSGGWVDVLSP
jgi:hypothetical protein